MKNKTLKAFLLILVFSALLPSCMMPDENQRIINKLKNEHFFLIKDENGIPNEEGLVLLDVRDDRIWIDPKLVSLLHVRGPIWERTTFPIEVLNFPNLKYLYLGMRNFEVMPREITQLTKLETISLQNSHFKHLPDNIGELKELRDLGLLMTHVEELPLSICELKKLERINLGGTKIKRLPHCLGELKQLKNIGIHHEGEKLPKELVEDIKYLIKELPNCEFYVEY